MPPFETTDFWERIAENLKHPPAPLPAWEPASSPLNKAHLASLG
jgi:hypothetical protein